MEKPVDNTSFCEIYDESVKRERAAWQALQSQPPGSPERELAWEAWSQAIVRTNLAWRHYTASRVSVQRYAGA
ncbi:MAG TPA: hypothetical protein VMZ74_13725 [Ramlibacter sp.]|nr:hypothetical protein [Ramlibacter sp.]